MVSRCMLFCFLVLLALVLIPLILVATTSIEAAFRPKEDEDGMDEGGMGPFCRNKKSGQFKCKSRKKLCGCASGSCEKMGDIDWDVLRNLNFTDGVVRMGTFKKEMKIPGMCLIRGGPRLESTWLIRLLGGTVDHSCTEAPTHAWNEIELPRSGCYLMLGGQTSAFRDRGFHGFRLVLHDTTFRWWERETGRFIYNGLLLHRRTPLSQTHVEFLKHLISNGDRRHIMGSGASRHDATPSSDEQFERSLDQDADLSPIFLELPPAMFVFQDDALMSMISSYFGLFGVQRRLARFSKPAVNCVTIALLFGKSPRELLSLVPGELHRETRAQARALNEMWQREIAPVFSHANGIFKSVVSEVPAAVQQWWQRWLMPEPRPRRVVLDFQQQLDRFRPEYLSQVMVPIKKALLRYDAELGGRWAQQFALTDKLVEFRLDDFFAMKKNTSEGCEAESPIDQILFCPDWHKTKYWQGLKKSGKSEPPSAATVVKETDIAVRRLLYWNAVGKIYGGKPLGT